MIIFLALTTRSEAVRTLSPSCTGKVQEVTAGVRLVANLDQTHAQAPYGLRPSM